MYYAEEKYSLSYYSYLQSALSGCAQAVHPLLWVSSYKNFNLREDLEKYGLDQKNMRWIRTQMLDIKWIPDLYLCSIVSNKSYGPTLLRKYSVTSLRAKNENEELTEQIIEKELLAIEKWYEVVSSGTEGRLMTKVGVRYCLEKNINEIKMKGNSLGVIVYFYH